MIILLRVVADLAAYLLFNRATTWYEDLAVFVASICLVVFYPRPRKEAVEMAAEIIDMVEYAIRKANPAVDEYAKNIVLEDGSKPNTLLYGEAYYSLEDEIAEFLLKSM